MALRLLHLIVSISLVLCSLSPFSEAQSVRTEIKRPSWEYSFGPRGPDHFSSKYHSLVAGIRHRRAWERWINRHLNYARSIVSGTELRLNQAKDLAASGEFQKAIESFDWLSDAEEEVNASVKAIGEAFYGRYVPVGSQKKVKASQEQLIQLADEIRELKKSWTESLVERQRAEGEARRLEEARQLEEKRKAYEEEEKKKLFADSKSVVQNQLETFSPDAGRQIMDQFDSWQGRPLNEEKKSILNLTKEYGKGLKRLDEFHATTPLQVTYQDLSVTAFQVGVEELAWGTKAQSSPLLSSHFQESLEISESSLELGNAFLDAGLDLTPGVGMGKAAYEGLLGRSLVTGEKLSTSERGFSMLCVASLGSGKYVSGSLKMMRAIKLIGKRLHSGVMNFFERRYVLQAVKVSEKLIENGSTVGWRMSKEVSHDLRNVVQHLKKDKKLPSKFITKKEAKRLGWNPEKGNLHEIAPGKSIGGDIYKNRSAALPENIIYYEVDLGYREGHRGIERLIYSEDGKFFMTNDHYKTFFEIKL